MPATLPDPHVFVILGGTGDLAARKLIPALYNLGKDGHLGLRFKILGVGRSTEMTEDEYRQWARDALADAGFDAEELTSWCDKCLAYAGLGKGTKDDYAALASRIEEIEAEADLPGNRTFYLSLPPTVFGPAIEGLGRAGLNRSEGWTRLVIEKPFGRDLESARELNALVHRWFDEEQIYRIDHYLGKETVQNLLVFRFGNTIFEDLWNRDRIRSVQITVAENLGVEDRQEFYETAGALRDMVQNHLTQVLSLIAMEVPAEFDAESVRTEKVKVLRSIQPIREEHVVCGQYASGEIDGEEVPGYRKKDMVTEGSQTETFIAMKLEIATWRWKGVPFYIRSGKRLPKKLTEIVVTYHRPPVQLFRSMGAEQLEPNVLKITLQPDEGFELFIDVKAPGEPVKIQRIPLEFDYGDAFGDPPDAYATLLLDILQGDQTLFVHADEVEASWKLYTPVLEMEREVIPYWAGSWGPDAATKLLQVQGDRWANE